MARQLSFSEVTFDIKEVPLGSEFVEVYNASAILVSFNYRNYSVFLLILLFDNYPSKSTTFQSLYQNSLFTGEKRKELDSRPMLDDIYYNKYVRCNLEIVLSHL